MSGSGFRRKVISRIAVRQRSFCHLKFFLPGLRIGGSGNLLLLLYLPSCFFLGNDVRSRHFQVGAGLLSSSSLNGKYACCGYDSQQAKHEYDEERSVLSIWLILSFTFYHLGNSLTKVTFLIQQSAEHFYKNEEEYLLRSDLPRPFGWPRSGSARIHVQFPLSPPGFHFQKA